MALIFSVFCNHLRNSRYWVFLINASIGVVLKLIFVRLPQGNFRFASSYTEKYIKIIVSDITCVHIRGLVVNMFVSHLQA